MTYIHYSELKKQLPKYPTKEIKFRGYKDGKFEVFSSMEEAKQYSKTKENPQGVVEKFQFDKEYYDHQIGIYNDKEKEIFDEWYTNIREEYKDLTEQEFGLVYNYSYERHHDDGYDEVYYGMCEYYEFLRDLKNIQQIES